MSLLGARSLNVRAGEEVESGRKVGLAHFMRALKIKLRKPVGNSLVVQWLRLHAFAARNTGSVPGWGIKILCAVQPKGKKRKKAKKASIFEKTGKDRAKIISEGPR